MSPDGSVITWTRNPATDTTGAVNVYVYGGYKNDPVPKLTTGYWPNYSSSYTTSTVDYSILSGGSPNDSQIVAVPASWGRIILTNLSGAATDKAIFYRGNYPVAGSVDATVTGYPASLAPRSAVSATITAMPDVSLSSSISVDGTLPVDVVSAAGVSSDGLAVVLGLGLLCLGFSVAAAMEMRHHAAKRG